MKLSKVRIPTAKLPPKVQALKPFEYKVIDGEKGKIILMRCKCGVLLQIPTRVVSFTAVKRRMSVEGPIGCPECGWEATIHKDVAEYHE